MNRVAALLVGLLVTSCAATMPAAAGPVYTIAAGEQLATPAIVELSVARPFTF